MKDNEQNPFDDHVRQHLEHFEMPYDPAAWSRFEQIMPKAKPPVQSGRFSLSKLGIAAAVLAVVATIAYLWPSQQANEGISEVTHTQEEIVNNGIMETPKPANTPTPMPQDSPRNNRAAATLNTSEPAHMDTLLPANDQGQADHVLDDAKRETVSPSSPRIPEKQRAEKTDSPDNPANTVEDFHLKMAVSRTKVCVGEEVSFMAICSAGGLQYEWVFGDGERSARTETVKTFLSPGTFEVVLTAIKGETIVERAETITVNPAPTAAFTMERPIAGIPLYDLNTSLQSGEQSRWEFSDGRSVVANETRHLFRSRGTASAKLTVTNEHGCSSIREQTVRIDEDFRLFAETGFTPNGDGVNDLFLPKALEVMETDFEMMVRDAFGREVFRTSTANESWNGREFNTGLMLPRGSYLWTVVLNDPILKNPVFTGNITIQ